MNLVSPTGEVGWVEDAQVDAALKQGYRHATADEVSRAKAGDQPLRAGLEGAARGLTMGLSDAALTGYYKGRGEDPRQVLERKEENPTAATIGEVGSMFAPVGAPGVIGKLGRGIEGAIARKAVGRAAAGAVEGGLWGLGTVISEDALNDTQLTGENLAAGVIGGALAGSAGNVIFGKVGDVGRNALVKAFGGGALKQSLEDMAANATMRQVTLPSDRSKGFLRKRSTGIGKFANEEGFTEGAPTAAEAARRASERAGVADQAVQDAIKNLDDAKRPFDPFNMRSRVEQELIDPIRTIPSKQESVSALKSWLNKFFEEVEVPNISLDPNAPKFRIELQPKVKTFRQAWDELSAMSDATKKDPSLKAVKGDMFAARRILQDEFFGQAGELEGVLRKSNDELAKSAKFSELAEKAADRQMQNRGISLTDYIVGSAAGHAGLTTLGPAGGIAGVVASGANKVMRERGGFVVGSAIHTMAQSKVLNRLAEGLAKKMEANLAANKVFGGPFRTMLEVASAKGAMDLLSTHVTLAQTDPTYLQEVGMQPENPDTVPDYADKAHRLGVLSNANEDMGVGIDKAIDRVLGKTPGRKAAAPSIALSREDYTKLVQRLKELSSSSESVQKRIAEIAPLTAGHTAMGIVRAAQFLLERAPKDPNEGLPPALQTPWAPSRQDLLTWNRYVRAVANPASVFSDIDHGIVTPEGAEALRQVYPRLYKEFRDRTMARLSELQAPLDRKKKAQVAILLGDLDDPQQVALIQAIHRRNTPAQPQKPDGREKVDVQRNLLTQAQRLENKQGAA